jgi:hypothetical protein
MFASIFSQVLLEWNVQVIKKTQTVIMLCQLSDCGKQPKYEEISCLTRETERRKEREGKREGGREGEGEREGEDIFF